jgi:DNA-binding XRE family transcriptional regulator
MRKATLAKSFAALRAERGLTLMEVAKSCDLATTTVLKVEAGRSVRWRRCT